MNLNKVLLVPFVALLMGACKHEVPDDPAPEVCFENDVLPIFQSSCAKSGCHDAITRADGYQLDTYNNIIARGIRPGDPSDSEIYEVLQEDGDDRMPPPPNPPLTSSQIRLIYNWIKQGARNTTGCATACDSSQFTYSGQIKPIMQNHCLGCHTGSTATGGFIDLSTYQGVKEQADFESLLGSISHTTGYSAMPKNSAKLSDCKITLVRKWIQAGAPNN